MASAPQTPPPRGRFTIVYLIHEAFRRDFERLGSAVQAPGVDVTKAQRLKAHWTLVNEQLHHHHQVEDDSLWPLVRPKLSGHADELAVLDLMEEDHIRLLPGCDTVDRLFASFAEAPDVTLGTELAEQLQTSGAQLGAHLDSEESRCFPVIDGALSEEEFAAFGKATAKAVGIRGSAQFFPWIFDGADPVERKAVLSMPPPPVRLLCRYVWEPSYARRTYTLWAT